MNREAVALGTPVYTTFEGRLGAVDERLIGEGRLRRLERAADLDLAKRRRPRPSASGATRPSSSTCCARRSGGLPQLAGEDALRPQPPLGGQAPELGRRARAGQVARGRDLGRGQPAEAPRRCPRRRAARRWRSPRPRRAARNAATSPESYTALAGGSLAAASRAELERRERDAAALLGVGLGRGRARTLEVGGEGLGDRRGLQVDPEALHVQPGHAPGGVRQRVGVVQLLRSNIMPSRTTRRYGPSRPCSAAALTAWHAGYDDRGGESSHTRGSIGIPLAAHASSTWCMVSTGRSNSRANPPIT